MEWSSIKTIAIIGVSNNSDRDSYKVAKYFLNKNYKIIPINPNYKEVLGIKSFSSLEKLPDEISNEINMVDIFRRSEFVFPIVKYIIKNKNKFKKLKVIWMQQGVFDEKAYNLAIDNGYEVIMNSCAMINH
jgi:uncharacterized protein